MVDGFSHYGIIHPLGDDPVTQVRVGGVMVSVGTLDDDEEVIYLGISEHFPAAHGERLPAVLLTAQQATRLIGDLANAIDCLLDQEQEQCDCGTRDPVDYTDAYCVDCGTDTLPLSGDRAEFYIVTAEVWAASGLAPNGGCLCVGCLEKRIGRQLTAADFPDAKVNDLSITDSGYAWSFRTPRLIARLSTP